MFTFFTNRILASAAGIGLALSVSTAVSATPCGGRFNAFVGGLKKEAVSRGYSRQAADQFFANVALDNSVLKQDRSQGVFRLSFQEYAKRKISAARLNLGQKNARRYDSVFDRAERKYGVPRAVILTLWALESDYGAYLGNFNTLNALITLSHDCRRPQLFRPQIFAAMELWKRGDFDPRTEKGAWAGEIGMIQMLPLDLLKRGVDGDGDNRVRLRTSPPDAIMTAARKLKDHGWKKGQPWMIEVTLPAKMDWENTGFYRKKTVAHWTKQGVKPRYGKLPSGRTPAGILLPQGRKGAAFMVFQNLDVFFEWNKSSVYVTTAAYMSTRMAGAPRVNFGNPERALSDGDMKRLQKRLKRRGHDVGKVDGILGAKTRAAVQKEQKRLGFPADAWPTKEFVQRL